MVVHFFTKYNGDCRYYVMHDTSPCNDTLTIISEPSHVCITCCDSKPGLIILKLVEYSIPFLKSRSLIVLCPFAAA